MYETSGRLAPVVKKYLEGIELLTDEEISYMRAYLRQWIFAPVWFPVHSVEQLRAGIDKLVTVEAIHAWLEAALEIGIDPL